MCLAACCPKANKQASLVEKKVCFISDVSNWGARRGADTCPKTDSPHHQQAEGKSFYRRGVGVGGYMQKQTQPSLTVIFHCSSVVCPAPSWLLCVQLIFRCGVRLFLFLCRQFSDLRQLKSWEQSGQHVVNFATWCFAICKTAHRIHSMLSPALEKELKVLDCA